MPLTLMYITNNREIARIAQIAGVNRIWVDMEYIGKEERQGGLDTVKSHHTIDDIISLRPVVDSSELMVRINPIHHKNSIYMGSRHEIEASIEAGADAIMLPMFKTTDEVKQFIDYVNGRVKTILLFETAEAVNNIKEILSIEGIDEVHVGLNDLHLAYNKSFMFELLADGTVERLCSIFSSFGVKYGFGGIARVGYGMLPAEYIIAEHYRLGSTAAILSRGFCDANRVTDPNSVADLFIEGVHKIREKETEVACYTEAQFEMNQLQVKKIVNEIVQKKDRT